MDPVPDFETGSGAFVPECSGQTPSAFQSQLSFDVGAVALVPGCASLPAGYPCESQLLFETGNAPYIACGCTGGPPLYEGDFSLMLVLDETGSIGLGGAQRGVDIIDQYGDRLKAIGWVSFGDVICQTKAPTSDLVAARAELASYADESAAEPFFCDGGGDLPENGVDALAEGNTLARSVPTPEGSTRYIHLVTDTASFGHNATHSAAVLAALTDGTYEKVYIEAADGEQEGENDDSPLSVDSERRYFVAFPAGSIIEHLTYSAP